MTNLDDKKREELLIGYGELFEQLLQSKTFTDLMNLYFTFSKVVDDETKTVLFNVVENPPEIIAQKMKKLSEENRPLVEVVSKSQAQRIVEQVKQPRRKKK